MKKTTRYRMKTTKWAVGGELYFHIANSKKGEPNAGINNFGVRFELLLSLYNLQHETRFAIYNCKKLEVPLNGRYPALPSRPQYAKITP